MSVADQINRIKTNIANTYTAAQAKGATMPDVKNSENLASCVDSITTGGGGDTQFGLTAEQMLGTLDGEGNLTLSMLPSVTFTGLKSIPRAGFNYKFYQRKFETGATVSFPDLTNIATSGIKSCFQSCTSLTSVDLSALTTVGNNGMEYCFFSCTSLTSVDLSALTTVGIYGLSNCFNGCTSLTSISFPSLTDVQTNSFGTASYDYCFSSCTALTEIHFRADMQETIEALHSYADKFGAPNASLIFDL